MKRSKGNGKLRFLYLILLIASLIVIINVFLVTIGHFHFRSKTSLDDYIYSVSNVEETIFASRGNIYDQNGITLAQDIQTYDIICYLDEERLSNGSDVAYVDNPSFVANALSPIIEIPANEIYQVLTENKGLYQVELGANGRNLTQDQVDEINAIEGLHGIGFRNSYKRYYPYGSDLSPQLIGFAQSDNTGKLIGKLGIESYLNDELSGTDGYHSYQQDKNGYILPGMYDEVVEAIDGYDVYLTLDLSIQEALNTCLQSTMENKNASRAWGAVVEINTGKILAWAQTPSFNPNEPTSNDVQVNYGSQLAYEPGSVMKAVIYSAAMDLGVYNGKAIFNSSPYCYLDDTTRTYSGNQLGCIHNVSDLDWGNIELDYGLIYSSNVATTTLLSSYVGVDNYKDYIDRFHLYQKVNTDGIDEIAGYTNYGLSAVDCITATYGQGSSTTMLQLLQAYTSIFGNGEMLKPYLIDKIVDPNNDSIVYQGSRTVVSKPISESTAKQMQDLLRRVVSDKAGTCRHYEAKTVHVMGKTGTSEIPMDGTYSENESINSCMLGFPYENPQYMIYYAYISPETVYYNYNIKPVPELIDRIALLEGLNVQESENIVDRNIYKYEMPNLITSNIDDATNKLSEYNTNVFVIGNGNKVIKQYPMTGENVYTNQKVFLLTDDKNIVIPDFTNWTRKEIIAYWNVTNLPITMEGYGVVYEQSILPNTVVDRNQEIIVRFKDINSVIEEDVVVEETHE